MIQPPLKVMGPGLDYHRPLEPLDLRPRYAFGTELVNQARAGRSRRPHHEKGGLRLERFINRI